MTSQEREEDTDAPLFLRLFWLTLFYKTIQSSLMIQLQAPFFHLTSEKSDGGSRFPASFLLKRNTKIRICKLKLGDRVSFSFGP